MYRLALFLLVFALSATPRQLQVLSSELSRIPAELLSQA